jgi:hypothetical protein
MTNFKYYAINYLDDWCESDRGFVEGICASENHDQRLACLWKAANYYKVARTLPVIPEKRRLGRALESIDAVADSITADNVDAIVWELEKTFQSVYGKYALSAASKFLWIRHRSPVVIYDGQAYQTLKRLGPKFAAGSYKTYRRQWVRHFAEHIDAIQKACAGLHRVKDFSLAHDMPDSELAALAAERWFHERVFDKFLWRTGA